MEKKDKIKELLKFLLENIQLSKHGIAYEIKNSKIENFIKKYFPESKNTPAYTVA
jgi:uncharacterized membrane-anchored protein YjiN (DUF445 family)